MNLGLENKTALVLGASRGLGAAIAAGLAAEGVTVHAVARSVDRIGAWVQEMPAATGRVVPGRLDLGQLASVDDLADRLLAEGGVDILVNNTGGPPPAAALDTGRDDWLAQFEMMAANIFHLTSRLLPAMQARKWGRIITIASSGVEQPIPRLALSNGIRSAVIGWSKTLADEVGADGVTVNVLLPGRIQTQRVAELDAGAAERANKSVAEVAAASAAGIPLRRYGRADEFADVAVFLASERASYITGSKIRVDGGAIRGV